MDQPAAVRDALAKTTGFEGATGTLSISEARTPAKPVLILSVQDGQPKLVKALQP
jgi:ABC-type branched-subunit amino acid transport system substrate-binding protein